jgi:hypothetical protein
VKKGAPDQAYTLGQPAGTGWGAVLTVALTQEIDRMALGGPTSGWRKRNYAVRCSLDVISYLPHLETAEAATDDLVDALIGLIYADRTLGTTSSAYATGRLITQAGEAPFGIKVGEASWSVDTDRGRGEGGIDSTFTAMTMVQA